MNLLELPGLREALRQIRSQEGLGFKEQCGYAAGLLQEIADREQISLKLLRKK